MYKNRRHSTYQMVSRGEDHFDRLPYFKFKIRNGKSAFRNDLPAHQTLDYRPLSKFIGFENLVLSPQSPVLSPQSSAPSPQPPLKSHPRTPATGHHPAPLFPVL